MARQRHAQGTQGCQSWAVLVLVYPQRWVDLHAATTIRIRCHSPLYRHNNRPGSREMAPLPRHSTTLVKPKAEGKLTGVTGTRERTPCATETCFVSFCPCSCSSSWQPLCLLQAWGCCGIQPLPPQCPPARHPTARQGPPVMIRPQGCPPDTSTRTTEEPHRHTPVPCLGSSCVCSLHTPVPWDLDSGELTLGDPAVGSNRRRGFLGRRLEGVGASRACFYVFFQRKNV